MRIDYCPKCNKAGLKYHSNWDDPNYYKYHFVQGRVVDECVKIGAPNGYGTAKWCPRCKEWVEPVNRPYVGVSK